MGLSLKFVRNKPMPRRLGISLKLLIGGQTNRAYSIQKSRDSRVIACYEYCCNVLISESL
jgi:hypothetical protein